jgi:hypothetical protein
MSGHRAFLINTKNVTFIGKLKGNIFVKITFDLKITGLLFITFNTFPVIFIYYQSY